MNNDAEGAVANCDQITAMIRQVRGVQVMLDRDLARLYGITTGNLNKAVKRNLARFPPDFMVRLSLADVKGLIFQNGTSNAKTGRGGSRHMPYAFTEQGVAMLSSVLKSQTAIEMNIAIMRAFIQLRRVVLAHQDILARVDALQNLEPRNSSPTTAAVFAILCASTRKGSSNAAQGRGNPALAFVGGV